MRPPGLCLSVLAGSLEGIVDPVVADDLDLLVGVGRASVMCSRRGDGKGGRRKGGRGVWRQRSLPRTSGLSVSHGFHSARRNSGRFRGQAGTRKEGN